MHCACRFLQMVILGVALFSTPALAQDDEDTIDWFDNYEKAVQEARRTNKPIFVEFRCEA
jgi:uncharacterized protein YyaL (SSP411 family)